jgi:hypothetical protein
MIIANTARIAGNVIRERRTRARQNDVDGAEPNMLGLYMDYLHWSVL